MSVFDPIDPIYALVGYAVCLSLTIAWLLLSKQQFVDRSFGMMLRTAIRMAIVFAVTYFCFLYAPRISWLISIGLAAITFVGVMIDIPVSGVFSFALLFIVQQFVLGFPARHERILHQRGALSPVQSNRQRLSQLVGQSGRTVSPLRPIGEVEVDDETYSAKTYDGALLEPNTFVQVIAFQSGKLIVREHNTSESADHT